jgi:hypothetical protein
VEPANTPKAGLHSGSESRDPVGIRYRRNQTPVHVEDHAIETPEVKAGKDEAGSALSIHIRSPVRHVHDRRLLEPVIAVASLPVAVLE